MKLLCPTSRPVAQSCHIKGRRQYEIKNHLGNVLATVSDDRIPHDAGTDDIIDYYTPVVKSAQDYYPFGMQMPGRKINSNNYRFGFQGEEADGEIYGDKSAYAFKYRMHDARIGRFWSLDPLARKFPHNSPYAFSENRLIDGIEWEGLEEVSVHKVRDVGVGIYIRTRTAEDIEPGQTGKWFGRDRYFANRTFAKAAEYNTQNHRHKVYDNFNKRSNYYQWANRQMEKQNIDLNFYKAAENVTDPFNTGAVDQPWGAVFNEDAQKILKGVNKRLFKKNMKKIDNILQKGGYQGNDYDMVNFEQEAVSDILGDLKSKENIDYQKGIENINDVLNNLGGENVEGAKERLGLDSDEEINFDNEKHRKALGKEHVDQANKN